MKRSASAIWNGGLKNGNGTISTESGVISAAGYSFGTRFAMEAGTNPEELIAAAHAGCFSMALSGQLAEMGLAAERIATRATIDIDQAGAGFAITHIHLEVTAKIPNATHEAFAAAAKNAKEGCPVSKALCVPITMTALLEK